jgi:ribosome-associated protein
MDPTHLPRPRGTPKLDGQGRPFITLAQFLKTLNLAGTGGQVKQVIRDGGIRVNGQEELRPGRKLHDGDAVTVGGTDHRVTVQP